ncbi:hypothetical protein NTGM5_260067 [Candidatus Nitrotoga sp. M5]|nr:hypothetical protein NTGM5_260067 [Candidatus Nitrotoga sp. M5]
MVKNLGNIVYISNVRTDPNFLFRSAYLVLSFSDFIRPLPKSPLDIGGSFFFGFAVSAFIRPLPKSVEDIDEVSFAIAVEFEHSTSEAIPKILISTSLILLYFKVLIMISFLYCLKFQDKRLQNIIP